MTIRGFRFTIGELAGALGDLGTLVPLAAALVAINGMAPAAVMLSAGLLYVGAGLYFRLPLPVQPLKSVSATAIALGLAPGLISSAGLLMGLILLALAVSGLILPLLRLFPHAVVRGIQLAVGLFLAQSALRLMAQPAVAADGTRALVSLGGWQIGAETALAALGLGLLALFLGRRFPASLALLGLGLAASLLLGFAPAVSFQAALPALSLPTTEELGLALFLLVLPQLPLTLGNAVAATAEAARGYFGEEAQRTTPRRLCASMGLANLLTGVMGGMPVCHGAGGLTAHYRFGARTGGAPLMLGALCLALGLCFGPSLLGLLALIPLAILGVLLLFVGLQHALLARDLRRWQDWLVAGGMGAVALATGNLGLAFLGGILLAQGLARWPERHPALEQ
ncbi:MAG: sulfate permease [Chloroflexi bacterium]|nr:sulfate permease [Chloroflexota bacterium]